MAFGEVCRYKNRSHEPLSNAADGKRFHLGIFVGIDQRTGQYMLHDGESIKLARTVVRMPDANKWDVAALGKVGSTTWDLHRPRETEVILKDAVEIDPALPGRPSVARQPYIINDDLSKFGYTRGCPNCDYIVQWGTGCSKPH